MLLTLFRSSRLNQDLKSVTAMAAAYLLRSYNSAALLKLVFGVIDCLCYLIDLRYTSSSPFEELSLKDIQETVVLELTHLWLYFL